MMPKKSKVRTEAYSDRVILFLDFLGFKEIVAETAHDQRRLHAIMGAIDAIKSLGDEREFYKSQQITQFSDSLVVSYDATERSAVFSIINVIGFMLVRVVELGFLVRGAVTVGKLFHSDEYLIGPAMVEAYELESKHAKYPRVLVSDGIMRYARKYPARHHNSDDEEGYVLRFLKKDEDGRLFIDYLSWEGVVDVIGGDDAGYPGYMADLARILAKGLKSDNPGVLQKYLWLHRHYAASLKQFDELPPDSPYRIKNPELCDEIGSLPDFRTEVKAAARIIAQAKKAKP